MYSTPVYSTAKADYSTHFLFSDADKSVGCIAGGIISAREIKIWRRSRQTCGKAALALWRLFRQNFISLAPYRQLCRLSSPFSPAHFMSSAKIFLTQHFYASLSIIKVRHKVTCRLCECRFLTVDVANNRTLIFKAWILL